MDAATSTTALMQEKLRNNRIVRDARREMGKFNLDYAKITLSFRRGTLSLFGKIVPLRGFERAFDDEYKALLKALQHLPGVQQIVTL